WDFFHTQKGSIISVVVLPTTEIIEPEIKDFWLTASPETYRLFFHFYQIFNSLISHYEIRIAC
ncbi:hypothetical protein AAK996_11035, partial [Streptococcus merionis]